MTGAEGVFLSTILPALIGAGGAAISAFGLPEGTEVQGFGSDVVRNAFHNVGEEIQTELANTRAMRNAPINIPTVPGFTGLSGDMRVAGLPTGTVGLFPNVEAVANTPISFGGFQGPQSSSSSRRGGGGNGGDGGGDGGVDPREISDDTRTPGDNFIGDDGEDRQRPRRPRPGEDRNPFGGAEGMVFANEQDTQSALDQIAMTIEQLTKFKSGVGRA